MDGAGAGPDAGRGPAHHVRERYLRIRHLARTGPALQLTGQLHDLHDPGGSERMAQGEAAATGVDGEPAAEGGDPLTTRRPPSPRSQNPRFS